MLFDLGITAADRMLIGTTGTGFANSGLANGASRIAINVPAGTTSLSAGTRDLIVATGGSTLNPAHFVLQNPTIAVASTIYDLSLSVVASGSGNILRLTIANHTTSNSPANAYWVGSVNGSWDGVSAALLTNWAGAATPAGFTSAAVPGNVGIPGSNVFITANAGLNSNIALNSNYTINSLNFTGTGTNNATFAPTISSGAFGTHSLTLNASALDPIAAGNGLSVAAGSQPDTINANIILGSSQTWINSSGQPLTLNGVLGESSANTR